jgi:hypothetical protein
MKRILLALVLLLGASGVEAVSFATGNDLLTEMEKCDKYKAGQKNNDFNCGFTIAYVAGVADAHDSLQKNMGFEALICRPVRGTTGQMVTIVRKYLDNYPEQLHATASSLVLNALAIAFPCE